MLPFPLTEASLKKAIQDPRYTDSRHPDYQSLRDSVAQGYATLYPDQTLRGDHTDKQERHQGADGHIYASDGTKVANGSIHVRSYSRTVNGKVVEVAAHERAGGSGLNTPTFDRDKFGDTLNKNAGEKPNNKCATRVRESLEAGGLDVTGHPRDAKDWGPTLEKNGFRPVDEKTYRPEKGDVAVIQPYPGGNESGHIAAYDGKQWISDFKQRDMWGGQGYRTQRPPHVIYRRGN